MPSENDLIQKLMISKAIMDKHNNIPRAGNSSGMINTPTLESFEVPTAKYNLPTDLVEETRPQKQYSSEVPTTDRIMNSKLPDEIKRLMIEHPISQPNSMSGPTLSNELVDKAARLMSVDAGGKQVKPTPQRQNVLENVSGNSDFRQTLKEVVREVLMENGILSESTQSSNDVFSFRVGKHIFEGKVTKIKKVR